MILDAAGFPDGKNLLTVIAMDASNNTGSANNSTTHSVNVIVENASVPPPTCTVYSCPSPPPPPTEPLPDPVTLSGSSPDGEFEGVVTNVDLQGSTVSVDSGGAIITLNITSETVFNGVVAVHISEVLSGHIAQGEFFRSTGETVWIEADLPPGL